jgi:hypothetical protein
MASRELKGLEQAEARKVFQNSLFFGRIEISDGLGISDRPWTSCGLWTYTVHLGPEGYKDALQQRPIWWAGVLIHELTHVWQGQNGLIGFAFMLKSVGCQCKAILTQPDSSYAYRYDWRELGKKQWGDYNVEQQASIVEDWYRNGLKETDPRFPYIRDNIRKGVT